jgi:NTP pyrophosphatase (non-canonical NTP hydrolase)
LHELSALIVFVSFLKKQDMTKELFEKITTWQNATFPQTTPLSGAYHLQEEVNELIQAFEQHGFFMQEIADCFILLFNICNKTGLTYDDINKIIALKMALNSTRSWGAINEKGYVKHIKIITHKNKSTMQKEIISHYNYRIRQRTKEDQQQITAIIIEDLNVGGMSVTNNIQQVVNEICTQNNLVAEMCIIVYRDSINCWDGWDAESKRFYHTGGNSGDEAVAIALKLQAQNHYRLFEKNTLNIK